MKKKYDDEHEVFDSNEESRKRLLRDLEQVNAKYTEIASVYDKTEKARKRLQSELFISLFASFLM